MLSDLEKIKYLLENSAVVKLNVPSINVYAKLEYNNFSGSIKDRAAFNILREAIKDGLVNNDSHIIESSSGNFAIALMSICQRLGLKFTAVVDPNINKGYESLLRLGCNVEMVDEIDATGGYLLTRISKVEDLCRKNPNFFWTNQYDNPNNYLGYYDSLGKEICDHFEKLDYIFIAVSSGGTITGIAKRLKENFPNIKVIGVDIEGSVVFGAKPGKRYVSGLGASKVPSILDLSLIDDVVHVSHMELIQGCNMLLNEQSIFAGGSSGAAYFALKNYEGYSTKDKPNVLFICADKGYTYLDTIYNKDWITRLQNIFNEKNKATANQ